MATAPSVPVVDYEVVIGLEVHAQLLTASKMFCRCSRRRTPTRAPNTHVLPDLHGHARRAAGHQRDGGRVHHHDRAARSTATIPEFSKFDRKNYLYPDLPKGYQISQYDIPLSRDGYADDRRWTARSSASASRASTSKRTPGASHRNDAAARRYSLVDLNRAGVPLMEIVSEPDMRIARGGAAYLEKLRTILRLPGRQLRQHGGGRAALRRQHLGAAARPAASSAPRSRSRT